MKVFSTNCDEFYPVYVPVELDWKPEQTISRELVERYNKALKEFIEVQALLGNTKDWSDYLVPLESETLKEAEPEGPYMIQDIVTLYDDDGNPIQIPGSRSEG
jgi:hypothetical protein